MGPLGIPKGIWGMEAAGIMLGLVDFWRSKAHPATCFVAVETNVLLQLGTDIPPLFPNLGCLSGQC